MHKNSFATSKPAQASFTYVYIVKYGWKTVYINTKAEFLDLTFTGIVYIIYSLQ